VARIAFRDAGPPPLAKELSKRFFLKKEAKTFVCLLSPAAGLARAKALYFACWPDGIARQAGPIIAYFVIKPRWLRYSSSIDPAVVADFEV
jgi:hypothetical protein